MFNLLLFLSLACAHRPATMTFDPVVITPAPQLADVSGLSNSEIIAEAAERRLRGDTAGARARLVLVISQTPAAEELPDALYQLGLCWERDESFEQALAAYDRLVGELPDAPAAQDGWFRRALCLEYMGKHREALQSLARVSTTQGLDLRDRITLDLQRGVSHLRAGRTRSGLRLIEQALVATEDSDLVPYLRAKAHTSRAELWLAEADRLQFTGSERRQVRVLEQRAAWLLQAEQEVAAAAWLAEPEWILTGLLRLGQGYQSLCDALVASRPPRDLSEEATAIYLDKLQERATLLQVKAWNHYDAGICKAEEWGYTGRPLPALIQARDAIDLGSLSEAGTP